MLKDDGDIIRGLGYVTIYSAYLEEAIDWVLMQANPIQLYSECEIRWPISQKLKNAQSIIGDVKNVEREIENLYECLEKCTVLFERRNEVVHGRVYSVPGRTDLLKCGRYREPDRHISSEELYDLSNELCENVSLINSYRFELPRAIKKWLKHN